MERSETGVVNGLSDYLGRGSWCELDDTRRDAGLSEDFVDEIIGVCCGRRGFPDYNVADEGGR